MEGGYGLNFNLWAVVRGSKERNERNRDFEKIKTVLYKNRLYK